jgi:hypothetical protein
MNQTMTKPDTQTVEQKLDLLVLGLRGTLLDESDPPTKDELLTLANLADKIRSEIREEDESKG